jgi:DNA-binding IclR family transcriptional regulator
VSAVSKALQLLSSFSVRDRQASLAELAARTGIPRATAFRLLATLEEEGFVVKEAGEYRPGFKCFIVGNVAAAGLDLRKEARPQLMSLRDDTGETAQVAILESWQVVYLERVLSRQAVGYMTSRAGAILPAYCTGLGKVLLAYRPEHEVVVWAQTQTFKALTPNTITTVDRMVDELRAIRDRGYAIDDQEREVGVRCIAAPIRDHEGEVVAALSVAGPGDRMPRQLVGSEMATRVLAAAGAISARLGYTQAAAESHEPRTLRRAKVANLA